MTPHRKCSTDLKLLGFDVDGVFTDGRFYLADDGTEIKAFHTQDGFGIRQVLEAGVQVVVISGRKSSAVTYRMRELGVQHVYQGCKDKVAVFDELIAKLGIELCQTAYVGDDIPDLPLLRHAGFSCAVANAVREVKFACDLITVSAGGKGAVREVCDHVLTAIAAPAERR